MTRGLLTLALLLLPAATSAQTTPIDRFDIAVGGRWFGPLRFESASATLTTPDGGTVTLFSTETELTGAPSVEARVGVRLTRSLHAEALASFGIARLVTRVTNDSEGASDLEVSESIRQMTLGGALMAEIGAWGLRSRAVPFVAVGGGYLRQLHEGRPIVETGTIVHAGGGVNVILRTGTGWTGRQTAFGLRADIRASLRTGGVAFDDDAQRAFSAGGLLFFRF